MRPPMGALPQEEAERFRRMYCGLCRTLGQRYGLAVRMILNYDFTYLAILLSDGEEGEAVCVRCPVHPFGRRCALTANPAMELAADESVILAYWQLRDGVSDHGFWKGLGYRLASRLLRRAYRRAAAARPDFDRTTRRQLDVLARLEREHCASLDAPADAFAQLLAGAADAASDPVRRRVLRQLLYHLGRWIYLVDAADDLEKDRKSGAYNPLIPRFHLTEGKLTGENRRVFAETLDHSIHMAATAFELWDFGCWTPILEQTIYTGLFQVGRRVLDGTFHARKTPRETAEIEEKA